MNNFLKLIGLFLVFQYGYTQNTQQEILIVGDMHQVPSIVKRAYKPMVKKILKYQPELIMAEYSKTGDTAAMGEWNSKFKDAYLKKNDAYKYDLKEIKLLEQTSNTLLDSLQFRQLQEYYLSIGDQGNHRMYGYFARHGATKKFKPYGNQNPDLTFQLMRKLDLKSVFGVDSHAGYKGYWPAWQRSLKAGSKEGQKAFKKTMRKDTWGTILAGASWSLGRYTNKPSTLDAYYRINSLRFEGFSGEDYNLQQKKWDDRNVNIAKNILDVLHFNATY